MVASFCVSFASMCSPSELPKDNNSSIPERAKPYIKYIRNSNNPSREGALSEQESNWNCRARSPYAKGCRQFTDSTGRWASKTFCRDLGSYRPYDPAWAFPCGIRYVERLQSNNKYDGGYCFNRLVAEKEYNGGGWILKEIRKAISSVGTTTFNSKTSKQKFKLTRTFCVRARWACKENYEYPERISRKQPKYKSLGGKQCTYK